ncbi:hypothetical protein D1007_25620 [Hordeum vulgare]|nr:hypothetical protein D1007_25620 [Hordeum vulgare]
MNDLEGAIKKGDTSLEEECRDLLSLATTRVFSHLVLRDPQFKFIGVIGPVPEESGGDLPTTMGGHERMLLEKFFCDDGKESDEDAPAIP